MTSLRIRWSTPADLTALTGVFARASLSNEGDREALLAHPTALVLEGDSIAKGGGAESGSTRTTRGIVVVHTGK